ncbi:hypothetical protein [Clostridium sp. Marseille-P2415]|uniref:hypothetical protein n=1 Tax=Clostridium sp. Marseille-P2415 TaxID=1805471 RepID=UPI0009884CEF|nr:hypothetical protein [Clostridium sp. Marseille-P2415]
MIEKNKKTFYFLLVSCILSLMIFIMFIWWGRNALNYNTKSNGLQDVIENLNNYSDFFKENSTSVSVVSEDGRQYLKIIFDSGAEALYGTTLIKVCTNVSWKYYPECYEVNVEIYDISEDKKTAQVSTSYDGGYGTRVCYYLPDFYDIKPDWGDYLQADLDVKKIISKEELQKMYSEAIHMEQKINEEYIRLHDGRETNRGNDKDELIKQKDK